MGFMPTIAKQLGYSLTTYGATMMFISLISTVWAPVTGMIVDKFHVKKILFMTILLTLGVGAFLLLFVPRIPLDVIAEIKCYRFGNATLTVFAEDDLQYLKMIEADVTELDSHRQSITCRVRNTFQYR